MTMFSTMICVLMMPLMCINNCMYSLAIFRLIEWKGVKQRFLFPFFFFLCLNWFIQLKQYFCNIIESIFVFQNLNPHSILVQTSRLSHSLGMNQEWFLCRQDRKKQRSKIQQPCSFPHPES